MNGKKIRRSLLGKVYQIKKHELEFPPEVPERDYEVIQYDYIPTNTGTCNRNGPVRHKTANKILNLIKTKSSSGF